MEWEDRDAREAKAANEAYMQELRRQHVELVKAEQMIFADAEVGEVIMISSSDDIEVGEDGAAEGGGDGGEVGGEDKEIDVDEWRSVFPDDPDNDIGPDPAHGTPYVMRKDWLDLIFDCLV
ncbi:Zinc finger protein CONSTANS-LIKE 13 [Hordeum vulgare]|nr:Zinc finger protein CONSTANS-LIKE 13 [Hordeum vulgare]